MNQYKKYLKNDIIAGTVVFFVALPLCLGVALASGVPLFSGIIAGIIGGIVVGAVSGSALGVSGPAAGLTVIVITAMQQLGDFRTFLLAVVLAGILQVLFSVLGAGKVAYFFPSSVIKGMLAAIGVIIILKQIPHALGINKFYVATDSFQEADGSNTISELLNFTNYITVSDIIISSLCIGIIVLWDSKIIKKNKILSSIPAPLLCVILGVTLNSLYPDSMKLTKPEYLVNLPVSNSPQEFLNFFTFPNWAAITNIQVWISATIIAVIASLETLLCVEATDKLDPQKNITPTNRELLAQGVGNTLSGLIGGIPLTQVVVRSSANINSGGKTKMSTILHGIFLLVAVMFIPNLLNKIPLSALAAVLIMTGFKLAKPSLFKEMYREGQDQFIPFVITIIAIVFTDLLKGITIGMIFGLGYIIYTNFRSSISFRRDENNVLIKLNKDTFFYNRAKLFDYFERIEPGNDVLIDGSNASFIDHDIFMSIKEFMEYAKRKDITVELKGITRRKINYRKSNAIVSKTLAG